MNDYNQMTKATLREMFGQAQDLYSKVIENEQIASVSYSLNTSGPADWSVEDLERFETDAGVAVERIARYTEQIGKIYFDAMSKANELAKPLDEEVTEWLSDIQGLFRGAMGHNTTAARYLGNLVS